MDLSHVEAIVPRLREVLDGPSIFGLTPEEYSLVLPVVDKQHRLDETFAPADLVPLEVTGVPARTTQPIRLVAADDLQRMIIAARALGHQLTVISAYRSYEYQVETFTRFVEAELRSGAADRADAERRANRYSARPGHSEHQLGTTVDVSVPEVEYQCVADLGNLPAGVWLAAESWRFGFVLSYPAASAEARTGYVYEPWHLRWVGPELATWIHHDGFLAGGAWAADQPVLSENLAALARLVKRCRCCRS